MKKGQSHINDELLVKHLLGEANNSEQEALESWISESDANRQHYKQLQKIWDESKKLQAKSTVNEDAAWERFQQRVQNEQEAASKTIALPKRRLSWMHIAAALVIMIGSAWLINFAMNGNKVTLTAKNEVLIETLPDGTVVTLNKDSKLKYTKNFEGDTRNVKLTGEAFFDVTPNKTKPFVIDVKDVTVTVVGTSFNVKSSKERTEVIVETGIVEVAKKNHSINVNPDEKAIVYKSKPQPEKEDNEDKLYQYYRTRSFVCKNTPLPRLVNILNEAYDTNIIIENEQLKELLITATFKEDTLEDILLVISETFGIKVVRDGERIILK